MSDRKISRVLRAPLVVLASLVALLGASIVACSSSDATTPTPEGTDEEPAGDAAISTKHDASAALANAGIRADRFATQVVSFTPGACAGFGKDALPGVVLGPPAGAPAGQGSTDVVSLGSGGEIVLSFAPNALVDGPGVDLLVFENAFIVAGGTQTFAEPGEVSVSDDGESWTTFPCTATAAPWGACAGWHTVAQPGAEVSPVDPAQIGGDPFDLADIGVTRAQFVRIRDKTSQRCTSPGPTTNGFDLDAIAAVHAADM